MSEIGYHERHKPYISAVAAALKAAGFDVLDWYADPNDPRDGAIQITPVGRWLSYDEVWIGWQEERRWTAVPYRDGGKGLSAAFVQDLDLATVASPASVVIEVAGVLGVDYVLPPSSGLFDDVDLPEHEQGDEENPVLEAALLRYVEGS